MKPSASSRLLLFCLSGWVVAMATSLYAQDSVPHYNIRGYLINDTTRLLSTNLVPMLSSHTGTNLPVEEIVRAACDLQSEYAKLGHPSVGVAVGEKEIANGVVTLNVFRSAVPQIRVSGRRYTCSSNGVSLASNLPGAPTLGIATNGASVLTRRSKPPTPEEKALFEKMAEMDLQERIARLPPQLPPTTQRIEAPPVPVAMTNLQAALSHKMFELNRQAMRDQMLPPAPTNSVPSTNGPVFEIKGYDLVGNTLLSTNQTELILQPYIATNATFDTIRLAIADLGTAYRERGFATVTVTLPQQTLTTNAIVKLRVFEGRLAEITVVSNRFFSSNNVMRALPSLHPNTMLIAPVFQAELDRANANIDRQIYPFVEPGPIEGTSDLRLEVKDRLPLHAKVDFNNQNSPDTPDMRVHTSAVENNLWQLEHTLGVQYSFSPELYKTGDQWDFYDRPLVANYGAFYRMPLGETEPITTAIETDPSSFGYSEATRQFRLPPPPGQSTLTVFASRSAIDTGVAAGPSQILESIPNFLTIKQQEFSQNLTVNQDLGFRLSTPMESTANYQQTFSGGLDYKTYHLNSTATNDFFFSIITFNQAGQPVLVNSVDQSPVPATDASLEYLPLSIRYEGSWHSPNVIIGGWFGLSGNLWYSSTTRITSSTTNIVLHGRKSLDTVTGSATSTGHWLVVTPGMSVDFIEPHQWVLTTRATAQWANERLVSTEQYGVGGVNSIRGYHEGEVFGDKGWQVTLEQKTPAHIAGYANGGTPLTIRGSIYVGYGQAYLIDPLVSRGSTGQIVFEAKNPESLFGTGIGGAATFGDHWEAKFLWSYPLLNAGTTEAYKPHFNFSLSAQF
jgi:hemolysin activation/secretion protein